MSELRLSPAWPNPFRDETVIRFALPAAGPASVRVYNVAGRLVRELPTQRGSAGLNERIWDGKDADGDTVASGIYFVRVEAGGETAHGKLVLVR